jgi:hypothetical protein
MENSNGNCSVKGVRRRGLARHTPSKMQWHFSVPSVPLC